MQFAWLYGSLTMSQATWKVLGNSFIMTPLVIDFTNPLIAGQLPEAFPDELRTRLLVNAEDFNGFPQKRMELIGSGETPGLLDLVENVVVISGDIHATFVTDHLDGVYEFTPPAISSGTNGELVLRYIASDPILGQIPGIEDIIANYGQLLQVSAMDPTVSPSNILYQNTWAHGYAIADVTADAFTVTIQEISSDEVGTSYYDDPEALDDLFSPVMFTIRDGVLTPGP
jgi:alkaline phosphatase D